MQGKGGVMKELSQFVIDYMNTGAVTDELRERITRNPDEAVLLPNSTEDLVEKIAYYKLSLEYWERATVEEIRARFDKPDGTLIDARLAEDLKEASIDNNRSHIRRETRVKSALEKLGYTFPEE